MPRGIRYAGDGAGAANAALLAAQILAQHDAELISASLTGAKRKPMKFWKIPIRGDAMKQSLRSRQRTTGPMLRQRRTAGHRRLAGWPDEPLPCRHSRASLPQRLSVGRKPRYLRAGAPPGLRQSRCISDHRRPSDTKTAFDKLGTATAPWQLLTSADEWSGIFDRSGDPLAIIKRRVGYDGRGQWRLRADETGQLPDDCYGECIVERGIHFSGEVSLVGARAHDGSTVFLPANAQFASGRHLRTSVAFLQANAEQSRRRRNRCQQLCRR